jgi:hypothetical protein
MIIYDLYVVGVTIAPCKAHAPAVIDPDAVLPCSIPSQFFQAVGWGNLQIIEGMRIIKHAQFPQGDLLDFRGQPAGTLAGEDLLSLTILE